MEAIQINDNAKSHITNYPLKKIKRLNSLECYCFDLNQKCIYICDLCSEKKFLRQTSTSFICDSSSFSDETN